MLVRRLYQYWAFMLKFSLCVSFSDLISMFYVMGDTWVPGENPIVKPYIYMYMLV